MRQAEAKYRAQRCMPFGSCKESGWEDVYKRQALLYISDRGLYPLQMVLREVLIQSDISNMAGSSGDVEILSLIHI